MSTIEKESPQTAAQSRKWVDGKTYRCVLSQSPGYKVNEIYTVHKRRGVLYMIARDGYEDECTKLMSGFEEYIPRENAADLKSV